MATDRWFQSNYSDRSPLLRRTIVNYRKWLIRKKSGIKAFANGNYNLAIEHFQASLKESRNDVETRIYLQNSIVIQKVGDPKKLVKIAVVVSIGSNVNIAQEMLREISAVQEVNQRGGILESFEHRFKSETAPKNKSNWRSRCAIALTR